MKKLAGAIFFPHPQQVVLHRHLLYNLLAVCPAHQFSRKFAHSKPTGQASAFTVHKATVATMIWKI